MRACSRVGRIVHKGVNVNLKEMLFKVILLWPKEGEYHLFDIFCQYKQNDQAYWSEKQREKERE